MDSDVPQPAYVELVSEKPVERFLRRLLLSQSPVHELVLVSPIIGMLRGVSVSMARLCEKIDRERIRTYVITNEPRPQHESHRQAVSILGRSDFTEIRFNPSLHAKVYVCRFANGGFALLGSGNLTETSIQKRTEIGVIIHSRGRGADLFRELFDWGTVRLRTLRESKLVKRMIPARR